MSGEISNWGESPQRGRFPTTRWSLIVASRERPTARAHDALASLCATYWYPLYAFVRRHGATIEDAQDLTQGFFTRLLEKHYLEDVDRERGRFRAFLLASFRHYIANERDRERSQKRGCGRLPISLDMQEAERRYGLEPADNSTPERIYERRWALILLERVLERLREDSVRSIHFDRLRAFLTGDLAGVSYRQLASELGMSEGALKVAVHRLRQRFRDFLREEIAETVAGPQEVKEEIRYLLSILSL